MAAITLNLILLLAGMALGAGIAGALFAIRGLQARVRQLEEASQKRLPYRSADEIENSTAALLKAIAETSYRRDLLENALAHLQSARNPDR